MMTHAALEDLALGWDGFELRPIDALELVREFVDARKAVTAATATIDQLRATLRDLASAASVVAEGDADLHEWAALDECVARARSVGAVTA